MAYASDVLSAPPLPSPHPPLSIRETPLEYDAHLRTYYDIVTCFICRGQVDTPSSTPCKGGLSYVGYPFHDVAFQCYRPPRGRRRRRSLSEDDAAESIDDRESQDSRGKKIPCRNFTSPSGESADGREEWIVTVTEQFEFADEYPFAGLREVGLEALIVVLSIVFHHNPRIHLLLNEHRLSNVTAEVVRGDYDRVPTDVPGLNSVKSSIRCSSSVIS